MINRIKIKLYSLLLKVRYRRVLHTKGGSLYANSDFIGILSNSASINLNRSLSLCEGSFGRKTKRTTLLRMDQNSVLNVTGDCSINYGADVVLFEKGILYLGNSFINSNLKIRCHNSISIGDGCAISHDCTIMDGDGHLVGGVYKPKTVVIQDEVWIGTRVTILGGVEIGSGSIVAAGSVVTKCVPPNCLVAGVPARVIRENVYWEK